MAFALLNKAQQAIYLEKQYIYRNIDNLIANYNNSKVYEKGPLMLLEVALFAFSPSSYIIGKAIAVCSAQWAPQSLHKIRNNIIPYLKSLSIAKRNLACLTLGALSVVILPKHVLLKATSFAGGVYYFQPPQYPKPTVFLGYRLV